MNRRLIAYVHIDGSAYGPDDTVPADVARRIGPHAWTTSRAADPAGDNGQGDGRSAPSQNPAVSLTGQPDGAPPRTGKGSGLDAWQAWAAQQGVGLDSDMGRDEVIAACEEAGVLGPEPHKE